jgi:hypothetical protein
MSSTSHLNVVQTKEIKVNKRHSSFNLRTTPSGDSSDILNSSSSATNPNYIYYVNTEPIRKESITVTKTLSPTSSLTKSSLNVRRKLSAISLPIPWYKRARSPSDDKTAIDSISKHPPLQQQKSHNHFKMSRDRLLPFDRLFSSGTHTTATTNDDEQVSPITEFTALDESLRPNEKIIKPTKENGYLHNSSQIMTR